MFKIFFTSRLNRLTYGSIAGMAILFLSLVVRSGVADSLGKHGTFFYYESITTKSFGYIVLGAAYVGAAFLIVLVSLSIIRNFIHLARGRKGMPTMLGRTSAKGVLVSAGRKLGTMLMVLVPAFVFMIIMSFALDSLNIVNKKELIDTTLLNSEKFFLGGYGFSIFAGAQYPIWFAKFIIISFEGMSGILLAAAIVVACVSEDLLRRLAGAFCACMVLMVPLWLMVPALSPQDRFIDNAYHLPMSAEIQTAVMNFHPVAPIEEFLLKIRNGKNNLLDLPTSTMPSAHTAWAVLVGYYLFRSKKWLGWITLPFLIGSTLGTVILAQHYLLDPIVGAIIAIFAIWMTERAARRDAAKI